jgi:protoheme IX farnesyltransferase
MSSSTLTLARRGPTWLARAADYAELLRPRITALVLTVVAVSSYVAGGGRPNGWILFHTLLGTLLVAGSASAGNQWWERSRDGQMARTAGRPLPAGRLGSLHALLFVFATIVSGLLYLGLAVNAGTAGWGAVTWLLYVTVYTPLKSRTAWSTAVGAVPGALPILMGWSAVGGGLAPLADPRCGTLFLVQVLWQFPHFMAIAWIYRGQYAAAGMQTLSVLDPSGRRAATHAVVGALTLVPLLGVGPLVTAWQFLSDRSERCARRLLRATLVYLPLLLALHVLAGL